MAELPKYQQTGRIFSDVPQLDFANVRESFKRSQSIANSLDRLSEFAGKTAQVQVERQAEQFAVENPITIEQLQNAQKSGISPDELIKSSGGGTIWEETLRKFQGEQLRSQLEVIGQKALADIQTQVQLGQLTDINEIKAKYESAINGMEAPIAKINPESALRFKQSMASTANSFYKEATKKLENDYRIDQQVLSQSNLETTIQVAKSTIATINDPQMLNEAKNVLFKRVYEQAKEGGSEFAQAQANSFLKAFEEEKINNFVETALSDNFYKNPLTGKRDSIYAYNKLVSGQIPNKEAMWESLNYKEKAMVFNSFRQRENELNATQKENETNLHEQDLLNVNKILLDYYDGGKKDKSLFKQLEQISIRNPKAISAKELDEIRKDKSEGTDKEMSKWSYSDDVVRLKEIVRVDKSVSWDTVKSIGLSYGIPSNVINRYVYPYYANPNERAYVEELKNSIPDYGNKQYKQQEISRIDGLVSERLVLHYQQNESLPPEKRKPIPSKSEIRKQIEKEEIESGKPARMLKAIEDGNRIIETLKITGIQLNKSSSTKDVVLMNRVNEKRNGKYVLDAQTRELIIAQIKKIEQNR